jgi:hypothetical protein
MAADWHVRYAPKRKREAGRLNCWRVKRAGAKLSWGCNLGLYAADREAHRLAAQSGVGSRVIHHDERGVVTSVHRWDGEFWENIPPSYLPAEFRNADLARVQ